jgi:hypothetical protein
MSKPADQESKVKVFELLNELEAVIPNIWLMEGVFNRLGGALMDWQPSAFSAKERQKLEIEEVIHRFVERGWLEPALEGQLSKLTSDLESLDYPGQDETGKLEERAAEWIVDFRAALANVPMI